METFWPAAWPPPSPWLITGIGAVVGAFVGIALIRVVRPFVRRAARRSVYATTVLTSVQHPVDLLVPAAFVQGIWHGAPDHLPHIAAVRHGTLVVLILAMTWFAVRVLSGLERATIAAHPFETADNLEARRIHTQTRVLARTAMGLAGVVGVSIALMTFSSIRQIGTSLLASAGLLGIIAGLAARPVLGNLIAGLQIGLTQPIRLDDVVIVEGEWGRIEEIDSAYVVVKLWDERRLVVPLQWWIEHPFQNWTRRSSALVGSVFLWVDYRMPIEPLRAELQRVLASAPEWDGRTCVLQVTDSNERALQLRALVSAADSGRTWDLRCRVRESLVAFVQREYPQYLPQLRIVGDDAQHASSEERAQVEQ